MLREQQRVELKNRLVDLNKSIGEKHEKAESLLAEVEAVVIPDDADTGKRAELLDQRETLRAKANLVLATVRPQENEAADVRRTLATEPHGEHAVNRPSAFDRFVAGGHKGLDPDELAIFADTKHLNGEIEVPANAQYFHLDMAARQARRNRIQSASFRTSDEGEELRTLEVMPAEQRLKAFGAVSRVSRQLRTANGNPITFPYFDDVGEDGLPLAEAAAAAEKPIPKPLKTQLFAVDISSGYANVQMQAEQDNPTLGMTIERMLLRRIGRRENIELTSGATSGRPRGVIAAAKGRTDFCGNCEDRAR